MEWIDAEKEMPISTWHIVFITDGIFTSLARWIKDPKEWYGEDLVEWDEKLQEDVPLDEEWHDPHWLFIQEIGPFIGNDECFTLNSDEITHWMNLPIPPKNDKEMKDHPAPRGKIMDYDDYSIENLIKIFSEHAKQYEIQEEERLKKYPEDPGGPGMSFNLPKAIVSICESIIDLKRKEK